MKHNKFYLLPILVLAIFILISTNTFQSQANAAVGDGQLTLTLKEVYVADLTTGLGDDDPYFPIISFRSRPFTPGSTEVQLANKLYDFTDLGTGEKTSIPADAGEAEFNNVHFSNMDSIAEGDFPEIIGFVTIAMENDLSISEVRQMILDELPNLEGKLIESIENGTLINELLKQLEGNTQTGSDGSNTASNSNCEGFDELLAQLPTGELDFIDEDFFVFNFIDNIFVSIADFYADDLVDINVFAYVTVLDTEFNFELTCERNNRTITISTWPTVPNSTPPQPRTIQYSLIDNPIVYKGDGGEWHVDASFSTTAQETTAPHVNYTLQQSLLTEKSFLPIAISNQQNVTQILNIPPDDSASEKISAITYNVQFLTPWNEGVIQGDHWPNTSARAVDIGAALACYDIVAMSETSNLNRRTEILGSMNANNRYCADRGDSSGFYWVSGPDIRAMGVITGWNSAITTFVNNIGQPVIGNELTIASRYPIAETHSLTFQSRYGIDSLAAKGVLHARLQIENGEIPSYLDVFATHLQAGFTEYKRAQVLELADFIYNHADPDIPILLMGDFNINGSPAQQANNNSDYNYLMGILEHLGTGHSFVDLGSHLEGGTNYSANPEDNRSERIDHILTTDPSLVVNQDNVQIHDFSGESGKAGLLSDHAAVSVILDFPVTKSTNGPDLVVKDIELSGDGVTVTIENMGSEQVLAGDDFWLDLYITPGIIPTKVNQIWQDVGDFGLAWGIFAKNVSLAPGETVTLTLGDAAFEIDQSNFPTLIPAGSKIYAQVDSVNSLTSYGGVLENHEETDGAYNNISVILLGHDIPTANWPTSQSRLTSTNSQMNTVRD